ncbi:MAG TPA: transcriptional regulator [Methanofastidiosum sp.]|nr:transcriptional regulator [Methanofastidiosum sp.]HQM95318.1 transcriptional regulator [Methanofastidiosum sp.]HQQ49083.1 transcriptional regulator [Methanofastidiosum sp.]
MEKQELIDSIIETLKKGGFEVAISRVQCSFDIVARRNLIVLIIKALVNLDTFSEEHAWDLKILSKALKATPLVVGAKTKIGLVENSTVYTRHGINCISLDTLEDLFIEGNPPLVYADRGGFFVEIDGSLIREEREKRGMSIGHLADLIGVSKSSIYEFENVNKRINIESVLKIEKELDVGITKPIYIIKVTDKKELDNLAEKSIDKAKSDLEKIVLGDLSDRGFEVFPTKRTPFNALLKEREILITGITNITTNLFEKKAEIVASISEITEKDAMFVVDAKRIKKNIKGVPILTQKEIKSSKDVEDILDLVHERKTQDNNQN